MKKGDVSLRAKNTRTPVAAGGRNTSPMLKIVTNEAETKEVNEVPATLDELVRQGARRMLQDALEEEVASYIARYKQERDERGRALVVRNGRAQERKLTCGAGTIAVRAPRVNDKRVDEQGNRQRFTSQILPPYMRQSPKVAEVLPVLYLRGLSTGDFREALSSLLGEDAAGHAAGLSPTAITRRTAGWDKEYQAFQKRDLSERDYVYVWADGVHFNVRLEDDRLCTLVLMGVCADGSKELIAVEDGYRESTESWSSVLRDLNRRGMRAPMLAIGDGALGFWKALRNVWPQTREQRDWCHKMANVLDKLPKRLQPKAKRLLREAMYADTREDAKAAIELFAEEFGAKHPKAAETLLKDQDKLLTYYDFPAQHWRHLRTSNAIESTFATVRLRQRVTKGSGSRTKALLMAYKLLDMAQARWRRVAGFELVPLVRAGVVFVDGIQQPEEQKNAA